MKTVIARFWALVVLVFLLIPGVKASGQTQYSQLPPDEISFRQARRAIVSASENALAYHETPFYNHCFVVNSSSIVLTLDSIEFDAMSNETTKKSGIKHFSINLKDINKVTSRCSDIGCGLATESGTVYTIQDKEAVRYTLRLEVMRAAWFAAALNTLHAYAISHPNDTGDFHQQAAEWRALTAKPPQPEEVRVRRLLAEDAVKNHKPEEALNEYEIGLQSYPTWPEGHFNAALIAAELNDFADAVDHMQSYLELVPNAPDAQSARDQITIWQHKAGQQKPAGAK